MYLAQNLRYLRERRGEAQKDIADLLGVPKTTMSSYENGYIEPNIEKLILLAEHFGITLDELIVRVPDKSPKIIHTKNGSLISSSTDR